MGFHQALTALGGCEFVCRFGLLAMIFVPKGFDEPRVGGDTVDEVFWIIDEAEVFDLVVGEDGFVASLECGDAHMEYLENFFDGVVSLKGALGRVAATAVVLLLLFGREVCGHLSAALWLILRLTLWFALRLRFGFRRFRVRLLALAAAARSV